MWVLTLSSRRGRTGSTRCSCDRSRRRTRRPSRGSRRWPVGPSPGHGQRLHRRPSLWGAEGQSYCGTEGHIHQMSIKINFSSPAFPPTTTIYNHYHHLQQPIPSLPMISANIKRPYPAFPPSITVPLQQLHQQEPSPTSLTFNKNHLHQQQPFLCRISTNSRRP